MRAFIVVVVACAMGLLAQGETVSPLFARLHGDPGTTASQVEGRELPVRSKLAVEAGQRRCQG